MRISTHERGFSMTEIVVGLVVVGIVAAATVPNIHSYRQSNRMTAASDRIAAAIRSAQARARSQNHSVIVEYRSLNNEFALIDDVNGNGIADGGEQTTVHALPDGVTLSATTLTADQLIFNARGRATNGGTIRLAGSHTEDREIRVSSGTGRISIRMPQSP